MKNLFGSTFLVLFLLLMGCSSDSEKPELPPTIINLKIAISTEANPDVNSRPSPVVIRVFALKSIGQYVEADFYALFDDYQSALGSDLVDSDMFHLKPGDVKTVTKELSADTRFMAVLVAYRDINRAVWKDVIAIPTEKTTPLLVFVEKLTVGIWKK